MVRVGRDALNDIIFAETGVTNDGTARNAAKKTNSTASDNLIDAIPPWLFVPPSRVIRALSACMCMLYHNLQPMVKRKHIPEFP